MNCFVAIHTMNIPRCNKLHSVVNGGDELLESEWTRLAEQVGNEWLENMNEVKYLIGSQIKEDDRKKNDESQSSVDFNELCKLSRKWLTNMTNSIENDDGKLLQTVSIEDLLHNISF